MTRPSAVPKYKPTKAELAAIQKGEAEIARGQSVSLEVLLSLHGCQVTAFGGDEYARIED